MENRILELEKRVSYQDSIIDDLNQMVIQLRAQVDIMTAELAGLRDQLDRSDWPAIDPSEEPPPPHY